MSEEYISFYTTKRFPNFNNILTYIIEQLENIIGGNKNVEEIKHNLSDIVIMMNRIINENKKNLELINSEITKLRAKTYNISSDKNKKIEFENGVFIGNVINSKKEGKGIFYYNNGSRYEGDWKNDIKEGKGIFYYNNGDRYEGDWKNGIIEGKGIVYYNNGDREIGDYLNNQRKGKHIILKANNEVMTNIF